MRRIWAATCLATFLLVGPATAADQAEKAEAAETKAGVVEEKASAEGSKAPPTRAEIITKPEAQSVDPIGEEPLDHAITCLARSIYWEAKGEGDAGMEAVAVVVMNRLGHEGFPNTICGVVKQGHEHGACQFSWWCDGRSDDAEEEESYKSAQEIARRALNRQLTDRTGGALCFHQRNRTPNWSAKYIRTRGRGARLAQAVRRRGKIGSASGSRTALKRIGEGGHPGKGAKPVLRITVRQTLSGRCNY